MHTWYKIGFFVFIIGFLRLQASQYGPNMLFQKPYDATDYIGNFTGTFCVGKTSSSYNQAGQVVPFLKNYGKQDILVSFIDHSYNHDIIDKIGTVDFTGQLQFACANLSYYKNIMHHIFLGLGTIIQNLDVTINDFTIELTKNLTEKEEQLLQVFESKIPKILNTSGILSAYLETGYNRKFTELKSLEFLQLYLKGAIITPQWAQGGDLNLLQYPFTGNISFGYQIMAILTMGISKHMNFGLFGTINSFQSKVTEAVDNSQIVQNQLLSHKKIVARYTPGTVYNGAVYWEIDNFSHPFTLTTGLSFMHGTGRKIKPLHGQTSFYADGSSGVNFNVNTTLESWNITALFFELDYNFLTKENTQAPCLTLFFNTPLSGYHYPKINAIGGEFGLTFNYPI